LPLSGSALRYAREQKRISQRELGRRLAARIGHPEQARALQVRLGRLEKDEKMSHEDRELMDALAAELAVGLDDLAEAPVWIYAGVATGRLAVVAMAMRVVAFTSPEAAYGARDALALASDGRIQPFADALLMPVGAGHVYGALLDENFKAIGEEDRQHLVEVDPDLERLSYLASLHVILTQDYPVNDAIEELTLKMIESNPRLAADLLGMHEIALRRVVTAPPDTDERVLEQWRREEERIFVMLAYEHQHRARWREEQLGEQNRLRPQ
jgi:hypothetical protein